MDSTLLKNGLWHNNPALVQLLGLCPLLAVSSSVSNALGLGLATTFVLVLSNTSVSLARRFIPNAIRIPIFVMIIAALVTCVQLLLNAFAFTLYQSLGIFIALIVTNCVIIARAEAFASKNGPKLAAQDGLWMGLGMTLALVVLGALRELLGSGSLFAGMEHLLGDWAQILKVQLFEFNEPFLLAILPPGAFIAVGFLIAAKNSWTLRAEKKRAQAADKSAAPAQVTANN
ncbi:MAG: electron transport complex subunit E [Vibrionaceae bacterium]